MKRLFVIVTALAAVCALVGVGWAFRGSLLSAADWTPAERAQLESLWIGALGDLPNDPSNAFADDPRAAAFGETLFFDTGLSANNAVSCATCHDPDQHFADGLALSEGLGQTTRHAPSLLGVGHFPWLYWDGRKDSLWSQALAPIEHRDEMGLTRTRAVARLIDHYDEEYESIFGPLPPRSIVERAGAASPLGDDEQKARWETLSEQERDEVNRAFANLGKAIAAYERTLVPSRSRFDDYVEALLAGDDAAVHNALSANELAGLRLFMREGNCTMCHNGPLFSNGGFHNIGLPLDGRPFDRGRLGGVSQVRNDEFNCLSEYSDAGPDDCDELRFMKLSGFELVGSLKTPSLRNVADTPPYMHTGQLATLERVVEHYNEAPTPLIGHSDLLPLGLSRKDRQRLVAFLETLSDEPADDRKPAAGASG